MGTVDREGAAQLAAANCPEMQELAGVLKTEITASLDAVMTPIIESIVIRNTFQLYGDVSLHL